MTSAANRFNERSASANDMVPRNRLSEQIIDAELFDLPLDLRTHGLW